MTNAAFCRALLGVVVLCGSSLLAPAGLAAEDLSEAPTRQGGKTAVASKARAQIPGAGSAQAIVVLVNDEPVTGYEIEQRAAFLAANAGPGSELKAKAEARWAQIVKDPKTNERLQQLLKAKNVRSEAEARAVQGEFAKSLQRDMIEQLKRESRTQRMPQFKKQALEELIEERLKIQEAKKLGLEVPEDEVKRVLKGIAEQNKMNEAQFTEHLKSIGIDISTMRERLRSQFAWREVIRRRFAGQVTIRERDIDRMISTSAGSAAPDAIELQVQKITLPAAATDQGALARRFSEAEALERRFTDCKSMGALAREAQGARYEDAKFIKPSSVAEPLRSMLLAAKDGDILPPATAAGGVEIYAVCNRRVVQADSKQREKALGELQQREYEIIATRYLRDIKQDAHIEYR
jgi:peptidyl-prolyl cis-trans isomerase SurA